MTATINGDTTNIWTVDDLEKALEKNPKATIKDGSGTEITF